ncbi:MAG TPA: hypothetical protein VGL34_25175 [Steroidobacteraceae bacterium]|jgi:hypothetical protein
MSGTRTPNLDLEYLDPSQTEPEVEINDAWDKLDAAFGLAGKVSFKEVGNSPAGDSGPVDTVYISGATVEPLSNGAALLTFTPGSPSDSSGSPSSPIDVTDGTHTVVGITEINFSSGALVSDLGGGVAEVYIDPTSGGNSANVTPDTHPSSPDALNDEFETLSLDAAWTWLNQGSVTATLADGSLILTGTTDGLIHAITKAAPATPYTVGCKASLSASTAGSGTGIGLLVRNSSSGKLYCYLLDTANGPFACYAFDNPTTFNATLFNSTAFPIGTVNTTQWIHMEIENDGTNLKFKASMTGVAGSYQQIGTVALATFIGSVSHVGVLFNNNVSGGVGIVDWFRRTG